MARKPLWQPLFWASNKYQHRILFTWNYPRSLSVLEGWRLGREPRAPRHASQVLFTELHFPTLQSSTARIQSLTFS